MIHSPAALLWGNAFLSGTYRKLRQGYFAISVGYLAIRLGYLIINLSYLAEYHLFKKIDS